MLKITLVFLFMVYAAVAKHEQYDGHSLYTVDVTTKDQVQFLFDLQNLVNFDVWSEAGPGRQGQILVAKDVQNIFEDALKATDINYEITVKNIKEKLDLEDKLLSAASTRSNRSRSGGLSFDTIHTYEVVDAYLDELASNYPDIVTVVTAGRSIEGRPIRYLRISTTNFQDTSKPVVYIQSLLHCREWVTLPVTLYAIEKLVIDVTEQDLLQNIDWIILPVANPDGYVFTHASSRFWRKNRATGFVIGNLCMGVDLNRNFDINWGTASSASACMETFHGLRAFSEPETAAIRDILLEHSARLELFLDIHSFGSMILYGYGNGQLPSNALTVNLVGVEMAQTIDRVKWQSNPNYIVGNIAHVLYDASGGASDYGMVAGAPYSYTYELPAYRNDQGTLNGFLVDPDFIEQAGYETWEGIKTGVRWVYNNNMRKSRQV